VPIPAAPPIDPQLSGEVGEWPSLSLTSGDGLLWDLTDPRGHVQVQPGWTGFDLPPVATFLDPSPSLPGAMYQGSHDDVRPLFVPIYTTGRDRAEAVAYRRRFLVSIHHSRGPALFSMTETNGTTRTIRGIYQGGGEGDEGETSAGLHWALYGLTFQAIDDPYWHGQQEKGGPWHIAAPVAFFPLAPALFRLSGSQVLGATNIVNKGDVDAYPLWTLKGPATELTLQLGERVFTITPNLLEGESLTINTDPTAQTITDGTGANRWGDVDDDLFELWALPPGTSTATVSVTGGTSATELDMVYTPRYLLK
jgi:hypothetical protein